MNRQPVVAGQFYPGDPGQLRAAVEGFLALAPERDPDPTLLAMVPHAGYVFSGAPCGLTLGQADLASTIVLLGPNHTGMGRRMAVWPDGRWLFPGGGLDVDADLAARLVAEVPGFEADCEAHQREHSLEVVVPFLAALNPDIRIVPVALADRDPARLIAAGKALAAVLKGLDACLVVSSDMSHYITSDEAKQKDELALRAAVNRDPRGLYAAVRDNAISMCGVLPMTLGLECANGLGASRARVTAYTNSGEVTGDYERVVAYAGVIVS